MTFNTKKLIPLLAFAVTGAIILFWWMQPREEVPHHHDFREMKSEGDTLRILTLYSSISYFIYKGTEMGAEYELATQMAQSLGLPTKIIVCNNVNALKDSLLADKGDLIAYNIPITLEDKKELIFCGRDYITHQVLVQRRTRKEKPIDDVLGLKGKSVYVLENTRYHERLINLNDEMGGGIDIHLIKHDSITTEELIEEVALGIIPYTVADNYIAELNRTYYNNIDIGLQISFPQRLSWAVARNSPELAEAVGKWFDENKTSTRVEAITKRYFEQSKRPPQKAILSVSGNKISNYDALFKEAAPQIGFDWRLLAAIAYQESKFDTSQVSWAGAVGLMQLMPNTAAAYGLTPSETRNPEKNLQAAVRYIKSIAPAFSSVSDPDEKLKFILASFNAGFNHVLDAMELARKYGKNPHVWDGEVAQCILWKSNPDYYNDPVCKYGYLRGSETFDYVNEVLEHYHLYKEKIKK